MCFSFDNEQRPANQAKQTRKKSNANHVRAASLLSWPQDANPPLNEQAKTRTPSGVKHQLNGHVFADVEQDALDFAAGGAALEALGHGGQAILRWMTPNKPELWFFAGSTTQAPKSASFVSVAQVDAARVLFFVSRERRATTRGRAKFV